MDKVIVVAGPTASGKSAYALTLAHRHQGVIINADSLQIYQDLAILTAQPSFETQKELPHRLYGILSPSEPCSVAQWTSLALQEINQALLRGKLPIIVGGTGLYLKALMEGLSPLPSPSPDLRAELQPQKTEDLYQQLLTCDLPLAKRISPLDRQRILRGLEVWYGTGIPLSTWQSEKPSPPPYTFETYLFTPEKHHLAQRLRSRLEQMVEKGVLEEVKQVLKKDLSPTASKAIGLKEFSGYLEGNYPLEQAKDLTILRSQQYAKRQLTWFRHQFKAQHHIAL